MATTTPSAAPSLKQACKIQRAVVDATPAATYAAIWSADLLATPTARVLSAVSMWPERARAALRHERPPPPHGRSAHLRDMLTERSPWVLLADEPDRGVVVGLLWTPPVGTGKRPPREFEAFDAPGFAKVAWAIEVQPFGAGHTLLTTETRTQTTDVRTARRFSLIWPFISPFAALLRGQVLRAVKAEAEML